VAWSGEASGETGGLLPELSPANDVPTPAGAGFLLTTSSSFGDLEWSMVQFKDGAEA
jgi:hypothetical protein